MTINDPNRDYFHINRPAPWAPQQHLTAGLKFDVGGSSNPYFGFFETQQKQFLFKQADGKDVVVPAIRGLRALASGQSSVPNPAEAGREIAEHFVSYVRELIWEDVRKREFPHLPSRQRCIWLVPTIEGARYWIRRTGIAGNFQVLRVRGQGRIHRASEAFLLGDSEPMRETIRKARQYWLGIVEDPSTEEVIFEGRITVLEVVAPDAYA